MPAAPVTSTITGSFSKVRKLHIYLTIIQDRERQIARTRIFSSNAVYSILKYKEKCNNSYFSYNIRTV